MKQASGSGAFGAPGNELLLAQALEEVLRAEHAAEGAVAESLEEGLQAAPEQLRDDLGRLLDLVRALQSSAATVQPSPRFREAARSRLMQRITADTAPPTPARAPLAWRRFGRPGAPWPIRVAASFAAVFLLGTAAVTASASALPGDPLYGVKQASEALSLRLAADDEARALALLRQADARLDETARLLDQGRAAEALELVGRYDETVEHATATLAAVAAPPSGPVREDGAGAQEFERKLLEHQERLQSVQAAAPPAAREGLERAMKASSHGLQRAAEVHRGKERGGAPGPGGPGRDKDAERVAIPVAGPASTPMPTAGPEHTPTIAPTRQEEDRGRDRGDDRGPPASTDERRGRGERSGGGGEDRGRRDDQSGNTGGAGEKPAVDEVTTPAPAEAGAPRTNGGQGQTAIPSTPTPSSRSGDGPRSGRDGGRDDQRSGRQVGGGREDGDRPGRR